MSHLRETNAWFVSVYASLMGFADMTRLIKGHIDVRGLLAVAMAGRGLQPAELLYPYYRLFFVRNTS